MLGLGNSVVNTAIGCFDSGREKVGELLSENYYIKKRKVLHGLPWAIVGSVAIGYFNGTSILGSAAFGAVNYTAVTFLSELLDPTCANEVNLKRAYLISGFNLGIGYAIGTVFVQATLKTNLTFLNALPLAVGASAGQVARLFAWE